MHVLHYTQSTLRHQVGGTFLAQIVECQNFPGGGEYASTQCVFTHTVSEMLAVACYSPAESKQWPNYSQ